MTGGESARQQMAPGWPGAREREYSRAVGTPGWLGVGRVVPGLGWGGLDVSPSIPHVTPQLCPKGFTHSHTLSLICIFTCQELTGRFSLPPATFSDVVLHTCFRPTSFYWIWLDSCLDKVCIKCLLVSQSFPSSRSVF